MGLKINACRRAIGAGMALSVRRILHGSNLWRGPAPFLTRTARTAHGATQELRLIGATLSAEFCPATFATAAAATLFLTVRARLLIARFGAFTIVAAIAIFAIFAVVTIVAAVAHLTAWLIAIGIATLLAAIVAVPAIHMPIAPAALAVRRVTPIAMAFVP